MRRKKGSSSGPSMRGNHIGIVASVPLTAGASDGDESLLPRAPRGRGETPRPASAGRKLALRPVTMTLLAVQLAACVEAPHLPPGLAAPVDSGSPGDAGAQ